MFNRRECDWYLGTKHKEAVTMLGLIAFAKKDYPKAKEIWRQLYELDPYFRHSDEYGIGWSYVKRLLWNIDPNDGGLFATPEEMKAFQDTKSRWMVLNADIELELQNYPAAEEKFCKLLKNKTIQSSRDRVGYCTFALAGALLMQNKIEEFPFYFEQFLPGGKCNQTPSTPRALLNYGNRMSQHGAYVERCKKGHQVYEYIWKTYPRTKQGDDAFYYWAKYFGGWGELDKGIEPLQLYLKKYPHGRHRTAANEYIQKFKRMKEGEIR